MYRLARQLLRNVFSEEAPGLLLSRLILAGLAAVAAQHAFAAPSGRALTGDLLGVHDPSIIRSGDTYYLYSTSHAKDGKGLIHVRTSKDLVHWKRQKPVFASLGAWMTQEVPGVSGIWAPDIGFVGGRYRLYYSLSTFGSNHSAIGLATSATLDPASKDYGWRDEGLVISSRRTDDFNAIDPNLVIDREGRHWLAFGSFWSGIKLIQIDPATGRKLSANPRIYALASRPLPGAVEAPFIISRGSYYYLFASYDFCCRGIRSTYHTVVGRSRHVTGPYVDRQNRPMLAGGGTIVLRAGQDAKSRWRGPGHVSIAQDKRGDHIVYHAYDLQNKGRSTLRVQPLRWSRDGWPVAQ